MYNIAWRASRVIAGQVFGRRQAGRKVRTP